MDFLNDYLNRITMYRLMLYYLTFLTAVAIILSFLKILSFNPYDIVLESAFLVLACCFFNRVFAKIFRVKTNPESALISGLILGLIVGPVFPISNLLFLTATSFFAMGSKFVLTIRKKHIFNPAAFGVVVLAVILGYGASWWIGNQWMILPTILGGLSVLKKIRRFELVIVFLLTYIVFLLLSFRFSFTALLNSPLLFFATVMLIEPLTSPPLLNLQIIYAVIIAMVFGLISNFLPNIYFPLELSLLVGNIFSFAASKNFRYVLIYKEKVQLASDVVAFYFNPLRKIDFKPGQFLEWTLPHARSDDRGIRRYFTISSSPTENFIVLVTKFYDNSSTFKQALSRLKPGGEIIVSDLAGEFTLHDDKNRKLVFIAGGIGITPFRSQVKWLLDKNEKRDVVLLYSNKTERDIVFKDLFGQAKGNGVRTIYINTDKMGYIDESLIKKEVADWKERLFYVSGPEPMVEAFEKVLLEMGVKRRNIKSDYFPGYTETHISS